MRKIEKEMKYFNQKWYVRRKLVKEIELESHEKEICSELKFAEPKLSSNVDFRKKRLMKLSQLLVKIFRNRLVWAKGSASNFGTNFKQI